MKRFKPGDIYNGVNCKRYNDAADAGVNEAASSVSLFL